MVAAWSPGLSLKIPPLGRRSWRKSGYHGAGSPNVGALLHDLHALCEDPQGLWLYSLGFCSKNMAAASAPPAPFALETEGSDLLG